MDDFLSSKEAQANVGEFSSSAGTNYMGSHGLISIIFIVAVCVLTVIGKKIFALAPAAVNFLMVIYDSFFSTSLHGESDFASVDVSLKIGGYLIIIADIIILAISIFQFLKEKNII